ncbi:hypothetical protein Phou_082650 [Phytohabitans houttuyneae]|uniref:ABC transmembrane type-1 domain-containing protein n=1 Tax=Phytohabitans houttuyneae TaxID=1076126 RepID=A0A6V8KU19_9ACTN|nr:hypothetical protein Phou_082650 [Phytohabitans houttuyneae]
MSRALRPAVLATLTVLVLLVLAPFALVAVNAVKSPDEYATDGPLSLPNGLYFKGITDFWIRVDFGEKLFNSFVIAFSVAVLAVVISVLNAYALGIGRVRGRSAFLVFFLLANLLPQEALVYPLYYLSKEVGLYNSQLAVVIIFTAIQSAFGTYLLSSVFAAFPARCWRRPRSTAPARCARCGGWSCRSAGRACRCSSRSSSSGRGTSSSSRSCSSSRTTSRPCRSRSACCRATG